MDHCLISQGFSHGLNFEIERL
uniref:Uncharacterized protein n=1 Tax=Rhizophora mucronata TaxID=61149 RepID=A0A2P2IHF5_RHIMU